MIDLHTHILPGMDDGAPDVAASMELLRMEAGQGVDTVVLTPHFYRDRERPERFLDRRRQSAVRLAEALGTLPEGERARLPRILLGAEVAWVPNLSDLVDLPRFCLGESRCFLLELPFSPWDNGMIDQIYGLMCRTGLTPILAHLERYWRVQPPPLLAELLGLGIPVQVSAGELSRPFSRGMKLLRQGQAHLVASDCHNTVRRPPNLGPAMALIGRKLGEERRRALEALPGRLLEPVQPGGGLSTTHENA